MFAIVETYNFAVRNFKLGRVASLYRGKGEKMEKNSPVIRIANRREAKLVRVGTRHGSGSLFDNDNKFRVLAYDNNTWAMCNR